MTIQKFKVLPFIHSDCIGALVYVCASETANQNKGGYNTERKNICHTHIHTEVVMK